MRDCFVAMQSSTLKQVTTLVLTLETTYRSKVAFGGGAEREDRAVLIKINFPLSY